MARAKVDFHVVDHGTICLLYANTRRAKQWVEDNLPQDRMQYADASVVEPRCIDDITDGYARTIWTSNSPEPRSPADREPVLSIRCSFLFLARASLVS